MPFFHLFHHTDSDDSDHPVLDVEKGPRPETHFRRGSVYEKPNDPNIVWWDGPNDPENPRNWGTLKKNINVALISLLCFITPVASAMFAPGIPKVMQDFHNTNNELASFVVSIFVLGFALGPIFLAPLSEIYGRQIIYFITNILFVIFTMACAVSSNLGMLIGFRFLAGAAGSAPLANGGGTISDLIEQERRGAAMAIFAIGPLLGPIVGPVAGGFLAQAEGWRWVFWVIVIAVSGVQTTPY
jgi:multidrug resistance protein